MPSACSAGDVKKGYEWHTEIQRMILQGEEGTMECVKEAEVPDISVRRRGNERHLDARFTQTKTLKKKLKRT